MRFASEKRKATSPMCELDEFGYWFSGFFDGEGTLLASLGPNQLQLRIQLELRSVDRDTVDLIASRLGGIKYESTARWNRKKPTILWRVGDLKQLAEIVVPFFDTYPLRTSKAKQYPIWREIVLGRYTSRTEKGGRCPLTADYRRRIEGLIDEMRSLRTNSKEYIFRNRKIVGKRTGELEPERNSGSAY